MCMLNHLTGVAKRKIRESASGDVMSQAVGCISVSALRNHKPFIIGCLYHYSQELAKSVKCIGQ